MPISVQPLVLSYSATATRLQARDMVDLAELDGALAQITAKLNEVIQALDTTIRDDDTLDDGCLEPRHMTDEFRAEIVSIVNARVDGA
jgi:hypothetical protein